MNIKDIPTVNSIEDFRITLHQLFFGTKDSIIVDIDNEMEYIKLNTLNSFEDIIKLGNSVRLTPKMRDIWSDITTDFEEYKDLEVFDNENFMKKINYEPKWVDLYNHNLRFLLENLFSKDYLEPIFGHKKFVIV